MWPCATVWFPWDRRRKRSDTKRGNSGRLLPLSRGAVEGYPATSARAGATGGEGGTCVGLRTPRGCPGQQRSEKKGRKKLDRSTHPAMAKQQRRSTPGKIPVCRGRADFSERVAGVSDAGSTACPSVSAARKTHGKSRRGAQSQRTRSSSSCTTSGGRSGPYKVDARRKRVTAYRSKSAQGHLPSVQARTKTQFAALTILWGSLALASGSLLFSGVVRLCEGARILTPRSSIGSRTRDVSRVRESRGLGTMLYGSTIGTATEAAVVVAAGTSTDV